ncbi:MAG: PhzF family phenazine biosynthesis protein [Alphaproteobacteria bacterium]|jgi:PhzF family phenazine biosynthesis protein|nr:PhzF family phenazine biosynthesis protein [Alphaproteobacteria bacterium]MBU2041607.1 PhzF family phenazine biosynthesis protein [Alphaproteobacteria bacterium]MBU2124564.1 PhzF family phenazine biosynthesis protein [Alphaproteobacteria bacterium]MBU2290053.1 PhzF family phenazine biosynthesis protein [Alphaproteobacteria bacterium]MBU2397106.1 PhzF family phenazine biosynthesis protein [Alphaproteobacteria bacterium]
MRQWTVDAFAAAPFRGNPACVVEPFDQWPSDDWMQALAKENNQAETAFLLRTADPARFGLRWFTPGMEVDLCGHATLASAHVLLAEAGLEAAALTFDTRSGPLIVSRAGEGYEMDFPADPPRRTAAPEGLVEALGVTPVEVWAGRYLVAVLSDAAAVRAVTPDIRALAAIQGEAGEIGQVIVCAPADASDDVDVVDRFFAPGCGVDEDPATGSAHCILGPLYADRLGRATVRFRQVFPGRGGDIETEARGERVLLRGRAVTVIESRLRV